MPPSNQKIIFFTAGAGGMFCGSCLHDNTLTSGLKSAGWNIQLVPLYTPIRTDERDSSVDLVFFGGINIYLQQKIPFLRRLPGFLDRFLDAPWLLRRVTADAGQTDPVMLGDLAVSMLQGESGNQAKEVRRLVKWVGWQAPELIIFSNALVAACVRPLKSQSDRPILVTLQGDDVFLDSLPQRFRDTCIQKIAELTPYIDGFIVHSEFYRNYISDYFGIPLEKFLVTKLGIETTDFQSFVPSNNEQSNTRHNIRDSVPTIGYLARLAPEKGLHHLVKAFIQLKSDLEFKAVKLKIAGWLGADHKEYAEAQWAALRAAGLEQDFEYLGTVDRDQKLDFLASISVLSVPTQFKEPKGLYALEALAAGVPIIVPAQGTFPELEAETEAVRLFPPGDIPALVDQLRALLRQPEQARSLGRAGQKYVHAHRNLPTITAEMGAILKSFLPDRPPNA